MQQFSVTRVLAILFYAFCIVKNVSGSSESSSSGSSSSGSSSSGSSSSGSSSSGSSSSGSSSSGSSSSGSSAEAPVPILGGFTELDQSELKSPEIQNVAKFATQAIASKMNATHEFNLVKVVSAQRQLVAGVVYKLGLIVVPNQCEAKKSSESDGKSPVQKPPCPDGPCDKSQFCNARVFSVPWAHKESLESVVCYLDNSNCGQNS